MGAESSGLPPDGDQGWGQVKAHPNLLISILKSIPNKTQGRERKGETKQEYSESQPHVRVSLLHLLALPTAKTQS